MGRILRPADPVPKRPSKPRPFQNSTAASSSDRSGNTALQPGNVPSELFKYIHNNLPINLVHAGSKRLYGRSAIWKKTSDELYKKGGKRGKLQWRDVEDKIKEKLQYAILSHRWLQEGEPTYEEMLLYPQLGRRRTNGLGFRKLREVCKKARTYGCEWVWVDTCCIDKRSSAELDESIRSMYRWYRDAKVCIVHLADTSSLDGIGKDQWFSRGWTLQELLAPSQIKFFTKNWRPLTADTNDKVNDSLSEIISERSGIPISQLRAFSPGVAMIREKMRWASGRNTTRIEDVGYSLICLFDVTMPIAYGEGTRAFYRLQTTLAEETNSMDLFEWSGQPSPDHPMFASGPHCFHPTTRDDIDRFENYILTMARLAADPQLPGGLTLEQGHTVARAFIRRGDVSFAMTNAGLRIALVLYNVLSSTPTHADTSSPGERQHTLEVEVLGPLQISVEDTDLADRSLVVGIVDYEWGDATGKPITSMKDVFITLPIERIFVRPNEDDIARQHIEASRRGRLYTALVLQAIEPMSYQSIGWLFVKRPEEGRRAPKPVFVS